MSALGVAVVSAVPGLVSSGLNYLTMANQKKLMEEAERDAEKFVADARKRYEQNAYEGLQVPLEAYRQGMREATAQQQQGIEALRDVGARGVLGGLGGVQAAATKFTQNQQNQMAQDIYRNELLQAQQEARNIESLASLDLAEARGAQAAAGAASFKRDRAREGVFGGLASGIGAGLTSYASGLGESDKGYKFADVISNLGSSASSFGATPPSNFNVGFPMMGGFPMTGGYPMMGGASPQITQSQFNQLLQNYLEND